MTLTWLGSETSLSMAFIFHKTVSVTFTIDLCFASIIIVTGRKNDNGQSRVYKVYDG